MVAYTPRGTPLAWGNGPVTLYHGTLDGDVGSVLAGVKPTFSRLRLDFGPGFYTTTLRRQAEAWAWQRAVRKGTQAALISFTVSRDDLAALEVLWFVRGAYDADDYWSFVFHCRSGNPDHGRPLASKKCYDVVVGPMAASWRQRAAYLDSDQMSFHTQQGFDVLNRSPKRKMP